MKEVGIIIMMFMGFGRINILLLVAFFLLSCSGVKVLDQTEYKLVSLKNGGELVEHNLEDVRVTFAKTDFFNYIKSANIQLKIEDSTLLDITPKLYSAIEKFTFYSILNEKPIGIKYKDQTVKEVTYTIESAKKKSINGRVSIKKLECISINKGRQQILSRIIGIGAG